ncbi:hypothetical protein PPERSA_03848 [Pseudocohnilembus persalinus]|uniref:Uncharacterized protein n=1 Tax=Pseudocohnilembus persalinus TaxID=266149 RepID=A0A0V0QUK2_PSEPJ|nr:hypothetical protein PPERSA_03848 [Pseudocohnilembus persalinus]|eukprot:KRX05911.1 hypothetical protein PPERSA_03848 [Pseudocohnilembus persalinus]
MNKLQIKIFHLKKLLENIKLINKTINEIDQRVDKLLSIFKKDVTLESTQEQLNDKQIFKESYQNKKQSHSAKNQQYDLSEQWNLYQSIQNGENDNNQQKIKNEQKNDEQEWKEFRKQQEEELNNLENNNIQKRIQGQQQKQLLKKQLKQKIQECNLYNLNQSDSSYDYELVQSDESDESETEDAIIKSLFYDIKFFDYNEGIFVQRYGGLY